MRGSDFNRDHGLVFAGICFSVIAAAVILLWMFVSSMRGSMDDKDKQAFEHGRKSYAAGIEANANPYVGSYYDLAVAWIDGYMDAKQEKPKPKGDPLYNFKASEVDWLTPDDEIRGR